MCTDSKGEGDEEISCWKKIGRTTLNELGNSLNVTEEMLEFLEKHASKVLDHESRQKVSAELDQPKQGRLLIEILEQHGDAGFHCLLEYLKVNDQPQVALLLDQSKPGKCSCFQSLIQLYCRVFL